jgi:glycosyltransferase involved in cell wall biosynthesis
MHHLSWNGGKGGQMRVLFLCHLWLPNHCAGAETTAAAFAKKLVDVGHQVTVQLSMPHPMYVTGPYMYEGASVYPYVDQADPLRWLTPENKPDLIVTYLANTLRASILGGMHKVPVITLMHNELMKSRHDLKHGTQLVVYNTQWMQKSVEDWYRDYLGEPPPGIVVRPPIFPNQYRVTPPTAAKGCVTLINLYEEKGSDIFYALAAKFPRLKFLGVCGAYGKQDVRRGLPNVEIIPHVAAHHMAEQVYRRTRMLLMPSSYESYGRAGVEAACSGIPTIAHPTEGLLEALGDGGTFCDREDLGAWAAALAGLTTAKGWAAASARARQIPARLTTEGDLDRWVQAAEGTARIPIFT